MLVRFDLGARDFPNRAGISAFLPAFDFGFLALDPAEHAGLMRPHVDRIGKNRPALHPDDLLVHEGTDFVPDRLEHRLACARVKTIPGSVRCDRAFDSGLDESKIELTAEFGVALDVGRWCRFAVL